MSPTPERLLEFEEVFRKCRRSWRDFLIELEREPQLGSESPWDGLEDFVVSCDEEVRQEFDLTLREMIVHGRDEDRMRVLSMISATEVPLDLACTLEVADDLRADVELRVEWILAIGQRSFAEGREEVDLALEVPATRHAAAIALAQLAPADAGEIGREMYAKDREEVRACLQRPLGEHDYSTFLQMAEAVREVRGKDGVNSFLRAVAGEDGGLRHEMAELAARVLRQSREEEREV